MKSCYYWVSYDYTSASRVPRMVTTRSGDGWTVEIENGVMIWEFLAGMELSAFREEAYPVYEELLRSYDVSGLVTHVQMDDPFNADAFEVWEQSARKADRAGVDRWAVVAEGITAISLSGKVETGDLDTLTTEDRTEAVEWAQAA